VHDHFEEGDGGYADAGEVVGVGAPGVGLIDLFLCRGGVGVEGIAGRVDELDRVLELWGMVSGCDWGLWNDWDIGDMKESVEEKSYNDGLPHVFIDVSMVGNWSCPSVWCGVEVRWELGGVKVGSFMPRPGISEITAKA
jgi:hypothetical protein